MPLSIVSSNVLLSYAPADAEWAESWLLPRLEREGLDVFVVNRDLVAGGARLEQLAEQVVKTQHTLLVLSPDWVASQWETFTGLISHSTDPLGRQRKTIPLLRQSCHPPRSIARLVMADFTSTQQDEWEQQFARLLAVLQGQQYRTALGPPLGALLGIESPTNFNFSRNRHFVGHEQDLAELHELLDETIPLGIHTLRPDIHADSHLAGLTGLGGIGKTQLAVEYVYRYRQAYPGGIFWINAANGLEQGLASVGRIINPAGLEKDSISLIKNVADFLQSNPDTLLVLDNLNDPALLNQPVMGILTLLSLPCRVLFTTRRRDLHGLRAISVDVLREADGLKLLLRSRREILDRSHPEYSVAAKICAALGGLPLALEMAASYLEQETDVTLDGYLKRLGKYGALNTVDSLENAAQWSPTWHDPVEVTLRWQWEALTNGDARILLQTVALMPESEDIPVARLSLLSGLKETIGEGFPAPLARALRHLNNYSLLESLENGKRARAHPLVREFVRDQMSDLDAFALQCSTNMAAALEDMIRVHNEILERGVDALLADLRVGLNLKPDNSILGELKRVLDKEAHNLRMPFWRDFPGYILQQVHNRAVNLGNAHLREKSAQILKSRNDIWIAERYPRTHESNTVVRTLTGHTQDVKKVAVTPDGALAATASYDKTVRVWDLKSGATLHVLRGHTGRLGGVGITADGHTVVSSSGDTDNTIRLWSLPGEQIINIFNHQRVASDVTITPDGRRVVSAGYDGTFYAWDLVTQKTFRMETGCAGWVTAVVVSPDGRLAAASITYTYSGSSKVFVWNIETGELRYPLETLKLGYHGPVGSLSVTPSGRLIASIEVGDNIKIVDLDSGNIVNETSVITPTTLANFLPTPDGKKAIFNEGLSLTHELFLMDLESRQVKSTFRGHSSHIWHVAIPMCGTIAVSASADNTLRVWDLNATTEDKPGLEETKHEMMVSSVAIASNALVVASASHDATVKIWRSDSGDLIKTFRGHGDLVNCVDITADGKLAISGSDDYNLITWDVDSRKKLYTLAGHSYGTYWQPITGSILDTIYGGVHGVAIMPDGKRAVSAAWDGTLRVWDLLTGESIHVLKGDPGGMNAVAVTSDSKLAVTSSLTGSTLTVWNLNSYQKIHTLTGHTRMVYDVATTHKGHFAISASSDCTLRYWDLDTGRALTICHGHTEQIQGVAISADDRYAVSASDDCTLRVWDINNGQCLQVVACEAPYTCCAIDLAKSLIVAGDSLGMLHFFDVQINKL